MSDTTPDASEQIAVDASDEAGFRAMFERVLSVIRGSTLGNENYSPRRHSRLVPAEPVDAVGDEVERYWLNAPFSYASIRYDDEESEHRYHVVEPTLTDDQTALLESLYDDVRNPLLYRDREDGDDPETLLREELRDRIEDYGVVLSPADFHALVYYLWRRFRGFGRLDPLMHDSSIEDISCDGYEIPLYAYHDDYQDIATTVSFGEEELDSFVIRMAQQAGQHISVGNPIVGTTLKDGSRAELTLGEEVTPHGSAFTIRKYSEEPFTPIDLLRFGTFSLEQMAYLWLAIENNKNVIFAGGTASGKTTSMNAISMFIPPRSKLITIEDTRELSLYHDNWLSSVTRDRLDEGSDVTMYDLLRSALRHRPEYILVGEVRGEEAITLFQAMNTGHTTLSTMHADSVQTVINRLENEPINVPRPMVQSLDVLCVQVLARLDEQRVRRSKTISEIDGIDQRTGELDYSNAFEWTRTDDSFDAGNQNLLDEIRRERGWSQSELLEEMRRRRRFLSHLRDENITNFQQFTALVNEYYADSAETMRALGLTVDDDTGPEELPPAAEPGDD
ncbi:type II secretion system protein [Halobacteriales archaeon SW_6_65_46]|nr:MAG: type II secretion system protein [Halobacteriales archaeon SW_6_65_46]